MLEYIKEYGVTANDYNYIIGNLPKNLLDIMNLSEYEVRKILDYYNSIGLTESISKIILSRPDLILIDLDVLIESINKIDIKTFINIVKNSIDDLIVLGI